MWPAVLCEFCSSAWWTSAVFLLHRTKHHYWFLQLDELYFWFLAISAKIGKNTPKLLRQKKSQSQWEFCTYLWKFKKHVCWTILLLFLFSSGNILKTNWLLVWLFAVCNVKLLWAVACAFHRMRETWTRSRTICSSCSGWRGCSRSYRIQPLWMVFSRDPAEIIPKSEQ